MCSPSRNPAVLTANRRLAQVRRIYRERGESPSSADVAYYVYAGLLVALIVGFPIVRVIVLALAESEVLRALQSPAAAQVSVAAAGLLFVGFSAVGSLRGPVALSPFFVTLLASTDMPRRISLRRPFVGAAVTLVGVFVAIAALFAGVLVVSGGTPLESGVLFVVASALVAILCAVLWLGSQAASARGWILPAALLALVVLTSFTPIAPLTPWGWFGELWSGGSGGVGAIVGLAILAVGACALVPRTLTALRSDTLRRQADRWQAAGTSAFTGDFATALGGLRAQPVVGRGWRAVRDRGPVALFLVRDIVGACRTPLRVSIGVLALVAAGALMALAFSSGRIPAWIPAAAGCTIAYLALGIFSDGFRHTAETAGAPQLYGYSTERLYVLHSSLPTLVASVAGIAGAGAFMAVFGGPPTGLVVVGATLLLLVLLRAYDSAKGLLPMVLLTSSAPSPAGDPMVLAILAWQADALLIASIAGGVIYAQAASGNTIGAAIALAVVAGMLLMLAKNRIAALAS